MTITGPHPAEQWTWTCPHCGKTGRSRTRTHARLNLNAHYRTCHTPETR